MQFLLGTLCVTSRSQAQCVSQCWNPCEYLSPDVLKLREVNAHV